MEFAQLAWYAVTAVIAAAAAALLLVARHQPKPGNAAGMARMLRERVRSPLMREDAVGARIADILTTPLVKEDFCLLFTIENDFAAGAQGGDFVDAVRVKVELDFTLVNVSDGAFPLRLRRASGVATLLGSDPRVAVDGFDLAFAADDRGGAFEIDFAPRQARSVRIRTAYPALLPYVGVFPQPTVVRGGARVGVTSNVKDPLSLFVGSVQDEASIADRLGPDDGEKEAEKAWRADPSLSCEIKTEGPLLPGEAVVLVVGARRPAT